MKTDERQIRKQLRQLPLRKLSEDRRMQLWAVVEAEMERQGDSFGRGGRQRSVWGTRLAAGIGVAGVVAFASVGGAHWWRSAHQPLHHQSTTAARGLGQQAPEKMSPPLTTTNARESGSGMQTNQANSATSQTNSATTQTNSATATPSRTQQYQSIRSITITAAATVNAGQPLTVTGDVRMYGGVSPSEMKMQVMYGSHDVFTRVAADGQFAVVITPLVSGELSLTASTGTAASDPLTVQVR